MIRANIMHEGQAAKQEVMEKLGEAGEKWAEEGGRGLSEGAGLLPIGRC